MFSAYKFLKGFEGLESNAQEILANAHSFLFCVLNKSKIASSVPIIVVPHVESILHRKQYPSRLSPQQAKLEPSRIRQKLKPRHSRLPGRWVWQFFVCFCVSEAFATAGSQVGMRDSDQLACSRS